VFVMVGVGVGVKTTSTVTLSSVTEPSTQTPVSSASHSPIRKCTVSPSNAPSFPGIAGSSSSPFTAITYVESGLPSGSCEDEEPQGISVIPSGSYTKAVIVVPIGTLASLTLTVP
jgi:hypothetical protein